MGMFPHSIPAAGMVLSCQLPPRRHRRAGLLRAEKQRGEEVTDLKLTCQTPHQYYDNSLHQFRDPVRA